MYYFYMWIFVLIASIVLEVATAEALVCIWFAPGAIAAIIANLNAVSFANQVIIFFVVSLLTCLIVRPFAKRYLRGNTIATNADRLIGQKTRLLKAITEDSLGEVKVNGIIWNCRSHNQKHIPQGANVHILAIEGSKLIVKEI